MQTPDSRAPTPATEPGAGRTTREPAPLARGPVAGGGAGRYRARLAGPEDEPGIRSLLRQPMEGEIRLALEREPDARLAAGIEGDRHFTMVVEDAGGRIVAMGSRAVRTVWVDGEPARVGYVGQLRRDPSAAAAAGPILRAGYQVLASTREPDELPFDLTSIAADNRPARRLLERGLRGVPRYQPLGELVTCLVPTSGPVLRLSSAARVLRRPRSAGRLAASDPGTGPHPEGVPDGRSVGEVVACLSRNLARRHLAPVWREDDLTSATRCRGLAPTDFRVVRGPGGEVCGCAALWDQRAFKQTRIRGYSARLARLRPLLNPLLRLGGRPPLPPVGSTLALAYLSHVAVDGDDPEPFLALLDHARAEARARGIDWLVTGFVEGHPLLGPLLRAARPRTYRTILYAVGWTHGARVPELDASGLHVEPATL